MTGLNRILRTLAGVFVLLAIIAGSTYWYLQYQLERTPAHPQQLVEFYARPAALPEFAQASAEPCRDYSPQRRALFGALHIHTAASYDATAFGVTNSADDAYAFSRGKAVEYRLSADNPDDDVPIVKLDRALDFAAVTDHAGKLGEKRICFNPNSQGYNALVCKIYRGDVSLPLGEAMEPLIKLASQAIFGGNRSARVCGDGGGECREEAMNAWLENQQATERWQDNSADCQFSSFHGYEYTLAEEASNLHRNVIFASATVPPAVVSAHDMKKPEQLWQWLKDSCIDGAENCDVMSIPHNSNWSSGRMWFPYSYRDDLSLDQQKAMAALRSELEPLVEIMQVKGDSECRNGLSTVYGGADELCDFEKLRKPDVPFEDCEEEYGSGGMRLVGCLSRFSFARYALSAGLEEERKLGVNPFKMGIVAATDNHNATPTADSETNYMGANGPDRVARNRLRGEVEVPGGIAKGSPVRYSPGGVAGVWAEENSRASIFAAMKRRETFGTSGPRIEPRFFGSWNMPDNLCQSSDMIARAYDSAVPMGGELPAKPERASSPQFLVSAPQDPNGNQLQKLQIIKGWVDRDGRTQQRIYDVAGDANNGASVNIDACEPQGSGFSQLCSIWQDPDFDHTQSAVYYSRIVENPSCRWSTWQCNALPAEERPETCTNGEVPKTIQERAWTSPIWVMSAAN